MFNQEQDLESVRAVCGTAAKMLAAAQMPLPQAKLERLNRELQGEVDVMRRVYIILEMIFSPMYVRSVWPHTRITLIDIGNRLRALVPNFTRTAVGCWGYDQTYNPAENRGPTLPMLVHAFSLNKEVDETDQAWADYVVGAAFAPGKVTARPALRSLTDPAAIQHLVLSCSVISNGKCATASPLGWILNAPAWNIFGFGTNDLNFANDQARTMERGPQALGMEGVQAAHARHPTFASLIAATNNGLTGDSGYNEIVVVGKSKMHHTVAKVTGIFVKVAEHEMVRYVVDAGVTTGNYMQDSQICFYAGGLEAPMMVGIRDCAAQFNLPLVPILDNRMLDRRTTVTFAELAAGLTVRNNWDCTLV